MATDFPTSLDELTNPTPTDALNSATVPHSSQHANANDAIEALQAKVGVDGSAEPTSLDYRVGQLEDNPVGAAWGGITGTLADQTDLNSALSGKAASSHSHAISAVTGLQTALDGKTDMTGFPVDANGDYLCTLTYNETTRTVTVTPTGASFDVWVGGAKYTFTGAQSIQHGAQQGGHFVYVNAAGTIVTGQTPWDILLHAPICYVFWDATNSRGIPWEERHHAGRDLYWHRNQHFAEGTKATSGFTASGWTEDDGSTDAAVTFAIATGRVEDEDIRVDTQALPDAGPYTIMHRSGASGDWLIERSSVLPFLYTGNQLQYNRLNTGVWEKASVTEDNFVNYWVLAASALPTTDVTPSPTATQQIIILPGQALHTTEALAHAETISSISWGSMPFQEVAPLYQVTLRFNATNPAAYANTARTAIVRMVRVVGAAMTLSSPVAAQDHGGQTGLTDDDHPQYTLTTSGSARAEINLGASPTDNHVLTYDSATGKVILEAAPWAMQESGDWTPRMDGATTQGTGTYSIQVGRYVKIGTLVYCFARLVWSAHTGAGVMRLANLPFTVKNLTNYFPTFFNNASGLTVNANPASPYIMLQPNTTYANVGHMYEAAGPSIGRANGTFDTAAEFLVSFWYEVEA